MNVVDWLLDSDPAIRFQVLRDLTDASSATVAAERARISREGLGARILASHGAQGRGTGPDEPDWLPTLFTMQLLRGTGADPADPAVESARSVDEPSRWNTLRALRVPLVRPSGLDEESEKRNPIPLATVGTPDGNAARTKARRRRESPLHPRG